MRRQLAGMASVTETLSYDSEADMVDLVTPPGSPKPAKRFRINAQNVFLTYPKCWLSKEEALELLLDSLNGVDYVVVAFERHSNGDPHLHVQIHFIKKMDFRKENAFDLWGFDDQNNLTNFHGNYQATRSLKHVAQYCTKEQDYILWGITPEDFNKLAGRKNYYAEALHSESYTKACDIIQGGHPRDWVLSGDRIRSNLKNHFNTMIKEYAPLFEVTPFIVPQELTDWTTSWQTTRTKCLCLIGASKLGKTAWARSLQQPHMYWKGMINIDDWNPKAKVIIFDDFDWQFLPQPKILLTQAGDGTITDRYRHKTNICVSMPAILLCNDMPTDKNGFGLSVDPYWSENMLFVTIYNKLF